LTVFHIPPLQIEPRILPPPLLTSEPGSFAQNTLKVRIPRIILDTIESNSFPHHIRLALEELRAEILQGHIRPLEEAAPDKDFWNEISRDYIGRSWLDVPWYWAETFFYRRMLEATRYFQPDEWHGVDPYLPKKEAELKPNAAPHLLNETLRDLPSAAHERFEVLLHASLWGNRTDLSYNVSANIQRAERLEDERTNLLVDDTLRVWEYLQRKRRGHLVVIADNAGTELMMDLALVDFLLTENLAENISLHLKQQPFFVSDAMPRDVASALAAMSHAGGQAQALARRVQHYLDTARLRLDTHWFYSTCLFYFQLPEDLWRLLRASDLAILKGDANYRRLLGDAHWSPTTPFAQVTKYFPAPLVALRTLKAEEIVGLRDGEAERLTQIDPQWMVNGKRGIVQANLNE
jgi:hypothetical protein